MLLGTTDELETSIVTAAGFAETTTWFYMCLLLAGNWALAIYAVPDLCKLQVFFTRVYRVSVSVCFFTQGYLGESHADRI